MPFTLGTRAGFRVTEAAPESSLYFRLDVKKAEEKDPLIRISFRKNNLSPDKPQENDVYLVQDLDAGFWMEQSKEPERKALIKRDEKSNISWYEYIKTGPAPGSGEPGDFYAVTYLRMEKGKPRVNFQMQIPLAKRADYEKKFYELSESFRWK
ncbi:MAG: hypothetical protein HC767_14255 [Akkermansiaceae bacterium]|nr:hypothetical protein [Akkermansiaceae bacterium]